MAITDYGKNTMGLLLAILLPTTNLLSADKRIPKTPSLWNCSNVEFAQWLKNRDWVDVTMIGPDAYLTEYGEMPKKTWLGLVDRYPYIGQDGEEYYMKFIYFRDKQTIQVFNEAGEIVWVGTDVTMHEAGHLLAKDLGYDGLLDKHYPDYIRRLPQDVREEIRNTTAMLTNPRRLDRMSDADVEDNVRVLFDNFREAPEFEKVMNRGLEIDSADRLTRTSKFKFGKCGTKSNVITGRGYAPSTGNVIILYGGHALAGWAYYDALASAHPDLANPVDRRFGEAVFLETYFGPFGEAANYVRGEARYHQEVIVEALQENEEKGWFFRNITEPFMNGMCDMWDWACGRKKRPLNHKALPGIL